MKGLTMLKPMFAGAIMLASVVITMFFWQFKRRSKDRFFGFVALAFLLIGLEHLAAAFVASEFQSYVYLVRLSAFIVLLIGIVDKNRSAKQG